MTFRYTIIYPMLLSDWKYIIGEKNEMASKQPESKLVDAGIKALRKRGAAAIKIHGSAYSRKGEPDVIGVYRGWPFAIEAKQPGEEPSPMQWVRLSEWAQAGARVGIATCTDDFLAIAIRNEERGFSHGKRIDLMGASKTSSPNDETT